MPRLRDTVARVRAEESTALLKRENAALKSQLKFTVATLDRHRAAKARRLKPAKPRARLKGDRVRVLFGDLHGAKLHRPTVNALLGDLKAIDPHEIILGGDMVDCGGFLATHHTLGYVAETAYSYEQDVIEANQFLDEVATAAPHAALEYLEGNHERRVETWCITQTLRHARDSEMLRRALAPEFLLNLAARRIPYRRLSEFYDGLDVPGVIKRDNVFIFHGITTSKHAAALTLLKTSANSVFFHTHRAQSDIQRRVSTGVIGAWNPGCLCEQQPLWQHGAPTDWTNGYAVQFVSRTGRFLHLNVPIIDGRSDFAGLIHR